MRASSTIHLNLVQVHACIAAPHALAGTFWDAPALGFFLLAFAARPVQVVNLAEHSGTVFTDN